MLVSSIFVCKEPHLQPNQHLHKDIYIYILLTTCQRGFGQTLESVVLRL